VAYPILLLEEGRRDLHAYLRDLEEVVIGVLAEFALTGERRPGLTGVWLGPRKVCSVGVAVRRWVTWHGLALNLHTDLGPFRRFHPCGLAPDVMTRVADHVELAPTNLLGEVLLVKHFCRVFRRELPSTPPSGPNAHGYRPLPLL
jgi:lipoate-protein ligase B